MKRAVPASIPVAPATGLEPSSQQVAPSPASAATRQIARVRSAVQADEERGQRLCVSRMPAGHAFSSAFGADWTGAGGVEASPGPMAAKAER